MDDLFKSHCREIEKNEYAGVFRALRRAFGPKPRMLLAKSVLVKATKPKVKKPAKPAPVILVRRQKQEPTDRELLGGLSDAVVRGRLTAHDALAAEKLAHAGKPLPADVRAAILGRR